MTTTTALGRADRPLRLHPLTYLEERGEVVVGRADIDSYGVFPPDGAALLRQLASGLPAGEAARWYAGAYGEPVDMAAFVEVLDELRFLVRDDETAAPPVRWERLGRWMFSPAAWTCYLLIIGSAITAMAVSPRLAPHAANLFFTRYLTVLELVTFLGQIPLLLVHESFHVLAGRRLGLRSSLRLGWRLYYLVFETTMDGLVGVPRRRRYLPMLAGMLADLLVIAILTLVGAATMRSGGSLGLVGRISLALAFPTLLRFLWQFYFYLRTDLYYVAVTVLGCLDLQPAARRILANHFLRMLGRPAADESQLHPRDRQVGRWYAWLMAAGYAFSIGTLAFAWGPALQRIAAIASDHLGHGAHPWREVADSVAFLFLNFVQIVVVVTLAVRAGRRSRRAG